MFVIRRLGRLTHSLLTNGNHHQKSGNPKGQTVALIFSKARLLPEDRGQNGGNHRAEVDGRVEDPEESGHLRPLLGQDELIGAKTDHARFYAACTETDQNQTQEGDSSMRNKSRRRKGD